MIKLLRRGGRFANQMRSRLYVLYVNNPDRFLSKEESLYLETCEKLSEQLGGNLFG